MTDAMFTGQRLQLKMNGLISRVFFLQLNTIALLVFIPLEGLLVTKYSLSQSPQDGENPRQDRFNTSSWNQAYLY